jgi:microcystin-dependent protein
MKTALILTVALLFATAPAFAVGTKVSALPVASTVNSADVALILQGGVNKQAAASKFTNALNAADLLAKILTVGGSGSGLDSDTVDGQHAAAFATAAQGTLATNAQPAATAINTSNVYAYAPPLTGSVISFAGTSCPTGFLKSRGDTPVSRTTYAALFAVVGTTYGIGDGSTTFNLPELRGEFVRGWDDGRGVDAGRAIGSAQGDTLQNITGTFSYIAGGAGNTTGAFLVNGVSVNHVTAGVTSTSPAVTFDASRVARTSTETRPRNVALLYCIKY